MSVFSIFDNDTRERVSGESYESAEAANHDYYMNHGHTHVGPIYNPDIHAPSTPQPNDLDVADWRLIAAAPELLEALKGIYAGCVSGRGLESTDRVTINTSLAAFKAMEAAITKATQ